MDRFSPSRNLEELVASPYYNGGLSAGPPSSRRHSDTIPQLWFNRDFILRLLLGSDYPVGLILTDLSRFYRLAYTSKSDETTGANSALFRK